MMSVYDKVANEIRGKTGLPEEYENEVIRRISIITEDGGVCEPLPKSDWIATAVIAALFGVLPVILVALDVI